MVTKVPDVIEVVTKVPDVIEMVTKVPDVIEVVTKIIADVLNLWERSQLSERLLSSGQEHFAMSDFHHPILLSLIVSWNLSSMIAIIFSYSHSRSNPSRQFGR
jgi:hypothetical protein